ncbi:MAG TPA: NUDIX hydrolase [Actinobacteria bacterium]|nr:NUDIX hydrolase [Actinomycetota bacterium]
MAASSPNSPVGGPHVPVPSDIRAPRRTPPSEETSAGGLVVDRSGDTASAALIGRLDRRGRLMWSLPKGHVEPGETREEAAIREVQEETGISGRILAPLGAIDFWFVADGRRIHKTVHHFLMEMVGGQLSADDAEVVEVQWVPLTDVISRLAYADERRLMESVPQLLADYG